VPGRLRAEEQAVPLGPLLVRLGHLAPVVVRGQPQNVRQGVQAVLLLLNEFNLVLLGLILGAGAIQVDELAEDGLTGAAARAGPRAAAGRLHRPFPFWIGAYSWPFFAGMAVADLRFVGRA